jgi:ABC-type Fe3+-hydroxamate transport system substrate-binding protein
VRIVSLVPSATETLRALGVDPVACTRFCEQADLPTVGGTKNPDVGKVVALRPDFVVVNDEENRVEDADALERAGVRLHSMSPRSVGDVGPAVCALANAVCVDVPAPFAEGQWAPWLDSLGDSGAPRRRAVTLVWRRPWMTMNGDTYGSSLLAILGFDNPYASARDRYPEVTVEEIAGRGPDVVLLPSEPYPFAERHRAEVQNAVPDADVRVVDGRDLFWWGIRTPGSVGRLAAQLR